MSEKVREIVTSIHLGRSYKFFYGGEWKKVTPIEFFVDLNGHTRVTATLDDGSCDLIFPGLEKFEKTASRTLSHEMEITLFLCLLAFAVFGWQFVLFIINHIPRG